MPNPVCYDLCSLCRCSLLSNPPHPNPMCHVLICENGNRCPIPPQPLGPYLREERGCTNDQILRAQMIPLPLGNL